jgi:hypothetical protein
VGGLARGGRSGFNMCRGLRLCGRCLWLDKKSVRENTRVAAVVLNPIIVALLILASAEHRHK